MIRKKSGIDRSLIKKKDRRKKYSFSSGYNFRYNCCSILKFNNYTEFHKYESEIKIPVSKENRIIFEYDKQKNKFFDEPIMIKPIISKFILKRDDVKKLPKIAKLPESYNHVEVSKFINDISSVLNFKTKENKEYCSYLVQLKIRVILLTVITLIFLLIATLIFLKFEVIDGLFSSFILLIILYTLKCFCFNKYRVLKIEELEEEIWKKLRLRTKQENSILKERLLREKTNLEKCSWELGIGAYWLELWVEKVEEVKYNYLQVPKYKLNEESKIRLETDADGESKEKGSSTRIQIRSLDEIVRHDEVLVSIDQRYTERIFPSRKGHVESSVNHSYWG